MTATLQQAEFRFLIDGQLVAAELNGDEDEMVFPLNAQPGSGGKGVIVGGRTTNRAETYEGAIFDVRIWNRPLTNGEIVDIYDHASGISTSSQRGVALAPVQVPMDNLTVSDLSPLGNDGTLTKIDSLLDVEDLLFSTTEETRIGRAFAMYDTDSDGRYATWFNDNVLISDLETPCPNSPLGEPGWVEVSDDVFVTDGDGFFSTVNDNPREASFNYGFESANNEAFTRACCRAGAAGDQPDVRSEPVRARA